MDLYKAEGEKSAERLVLKGLIHVAFREKLPAYAKEEPFRMVVEDKIKELARRLDSKEQQTAFIAGAKDAMDDMFGITAPSSP